MLYQQKLRLPFVNDLKYLGNVLQSDNQMTIDCNKKRAIFISKIHSLNQEFYFNSPELKTLEWWISGLRLKPLFFLISSLNIACSPHEFKLQKS